MAATNAAKAAAAKKDVISDVKEMGNDVKDLVERSADLVEDSVEVVRIAWIRSNPKAVVIATGTLTLILGVTAGYLAASKRLQTKYQKLADEQIADVKSKYTVERVIEEKPSLDALVTQVEHDEAVSTAQKIIDGQGYSRYNKVESKNVAEVDDDDSVIAPEDGTIMTQEVVESTSVSRNVFESDNPDTYFDFAEELDFRQNHPDRPCVITKEEFDQGDLEYEQTVMTYYKGDDVLADQQDQPIDEIDKTIGAENTLRFGHGSGDPLVVYIRNPALGLDIEVTHSDGKFAQEVLGFDQSELRHSQDRRKPRKFRDSDE